VKKILYILFSLFVFFNINLLQADSIKQGLLNKLLAPGPLMEGHQNLEKVDCLSCHDAGKGVPNANCLSCHKEIKQSIDRKNTFHGLASLKKNCIECHSDHKGRDLDTTEVDAKKFDHATTGHVLHGKHKDIKCVDCHKETREKMAIRKDGTHYMGLTTTCKSCHLKQDVHLFKDDLAKKDCDSCHNEVKWKEAKEFDHEKDFKFKLEGKHAEMACSRCHTPNGDRIGPSIYKWPNLKTDSCLACHRPYHKDTLSEKYNGGECSKCHDQTTWKIPKFNHSITGMTLNGKHADITCIKCHIQTPGRLEVTYKLLTGTVKLVPQKWTGSKSACISCHKDIHLFGALVSKRFGKLDKCQTCHNERNFKEGLNFNHTLDTRFKVDGKHNELTCIKCHTNDVASSDLTRKYFFKDLEKDNCVICHKSPHLQTFSKKNLDKRCSSCHVTSGWKETKKSDQFNHNTDTHFSLEGKHTNLKCNSCHKDGANKIYKFGFADKQYCEACHATVHKNQFSSKFTEKSCLECHGVDSFKTLKPFDHNKTNFALDGKHSDPKVRCIQCHKATSEYINYKGVDIRLKNNFKFIDDKKGLCESCHQNVHSGQFSKSTQEKACTVCHSTQNFHQRKPFNHSMTKFPLIGFHEKADCLKCHVKTNFAFEFKPYNPKHRFAFKGLTTDNCKVCHKDVHKGEFGNNCKDCHNESKKWKTSQNFHKDFLLTGVHYSLKCDECHKDQRRLGGMSESCLMCHQKDDRHHGTLPNCKECHKQEFWEVTSFKHSLTAFPLRGSHRVLGCDSCHSNGMYQGKSSECISCHMKDKSKSVTVNHNIVGFENCSSCHNQFVFK
jgi:hypothetical protein